MAAAAERLHGVYESAKTASALVPDAALKAVQEGSQWRVAGADGKPLSATLYDDVAEPEGGVVRVVKDGKYGLVAAGWGEIVPCSFDYITEFNADGYAEVWNNGFTGHVSKHGHVDLEENLMKNAQNEVRFGKDVTPIQKYVEYNPTSIQGYMLLAEWCERNKYYTDAYKAYDMVFALAEEQGKQDMVANKSRTATIYTICRKAWCMRRSRRFLNLWGSWSKRRWRYAIPSGKSSMALRPRRQALCLRAACLPAAVTKRSTSDGKTLPSGIITR